MGRSFAGGAAMAGDASTVFTNPAGMTELSGAEIVAGFTLFSPNLRFSDNGSSANTIGSGGVPVTYTGGNGGNPFDPQGLPNLYIAYPMMDDRLWVGLGVSTPFGLAQEYENGWFGRYDSLKSELRVFNIGPSVAFALDDHVSVSAGLDIQYAKAELTNAVPDILRAGGPTAGSDGLSKLEGSDWSMGFNVGLLVKPLPSTRIGAHFRSGFSHDLDGSNTVSGLGGALAAANGRLDGMTKLELPDIVSLGIAHEVTSGLTLLADFQWFHWSRFEEIRLRFDDGSPDQVIPANYENCYAVSVGLEYEALDNLTLRGGFRYDQTPTVDQFRQTSVADADSYAVSVGASYTVLDGVTIDLAYYYAWWEDIAIDVNRNFQFGPGVRGNVNVKGTGTSRSNIFGLSLRYQF